MEILEYKVIEYKEDKCTVRIHRPILTEEEREKRMQDAKLALMQYGRERRVKNMATMRERKQWGEEAEALVKARKAEEQAVQKIKYGKKTIFSKKGTKLNMTDFEE